MATRGKAFTAHLYAYDSTTGKPKTGDSANITARLAKDGTGAALTTTTVTEVDATNLPGSYKVSISATEADCDALVVGGKSSTADVFIVPTVYQMERLPDAAPDAAGGVRDVARFAGSAVQQAGGYLRVRDLDDAAIAKQSTASAAQTAAEAARDDLANGTDGLGAIHAAVTNLTGNTTSSAVAPKAMERPDSGSKTYRLHLMLYDSDGNMEAPDQAPTVTAENDQGTDRSANLSAVSLVSTGHYRADYTVASGHALEALTFIWSVVEGGKTREVLAASYVAETTAELFTSADRAKLDTLHDTRLTAARAGYLDELAAANLPADVDTLKTRLPGVVQPQTGDAYARIGAPAGASLAADVAAVLAAIGALEDLSSADVQAAVLAALGTGRAELSALPAAGASPLDKLELIFMALRNLIEQRADSRKIHRADGTVLGTSAVADASGVLSIGRMT